MLFLDIDFGYNLLRIKYSTSKFALSILNSIFLFIVLILYIIHITLPDFLSIITIGHFLSSGMADVFMGLIYELYID